MRIAAIIPAYEAAATIGGLVDELARAGSFDPIVVVDDGSLDETAARARAAGALVVRHTRNRGKGAALRSALARALYAGATHAVSLDADGQHPPAEAQRLAELAVPTEALVLGIRDLVAAGAPRANQRSNGISNWWLSRFTGRSLADTQCGLRRYPITATLALGAQSRGFGFEAEVVLRAALAGLPLVEEPIQVHYPPETDRTSHFHVVRDPTRIVLRVLATLATAPRHR